MAKINLPDIGSLANNASARQAINDNFAAIEAAFDDTVSRSGALPNQMEADLDLNGNDLLNVKRVDASEYFQNGIPWEQSVTYGDKLYDIFSGDGVQVDFPLKIDPASLANLEVTVAGLMKRPGLDYVYNGTTLTFIVPPAVGTNNILIRYDFAVPTGITTTDAVTYTPPSTGIPNSLRAFLDSLWATGANAGAKLIRWIQEGTGAVPRTVEDKLREVVSVKDFGAVGDGVADDTAAVQAFLASGGTLDWGSGTYRITAQAAITATKDIHWRSSGAKLVVDSVSAIESAIKIELAGFSARLVGALEIECQSKSYAGLLVLNNGGGLPTVELDGMIVRNVYRSGTAFNYGDGILVFGQYGRVVIRNFEVHGVRMATGAGTPFVIGVSGVSVLRLNNTASDAESVLIEDFFIDGVYSEDVTYGARDQDGVRVQQAYSKNQLTDGTNPVFALVKNGRIKNAHGRAVKLVSEYGIVADIEVVRDDTIYSGFSPGSSEDFDFQVSGGTARGIRCYYNTNCPESVFTFTCNLVSNRRSPNAVNVDDVIVSQFGGTFINRLASVAVETAPVNPLNIICNFSNVHVGGTTTELDEVVRLYNVNDLANTWYWAILLSNVTARVTTTFVYREQATVANDLKVTGISCHQARPTTVPLATGNLLTGITTSLIGQNSRLS